MRTRKFRGKRINRNGEWAYGDLRILPDRILILPQRSYDAAIDRDAVDETTLETHQYNWGYDPLNYNVPDGSYSTDPYDPKTRINEFKQMVMACHKAGIRVIMDVVYNHVMDAATSNFELTAPGYFFRKKEDGSLANGSGCGNETASDHPMMQTYMVQSIQYWMTEYHIDGFRFDLMGIHDIETMNEISSTPWFCFTVRVGQQRLPHILRRNLP